MSSGAAYTGVLSALDPTTPAALSVAVLVPAAGLLLVTVGRTALTDSPVTERTLADTSAAWRARQDSNLRPSD
jgi:hypothetical protein